MKRRGLLVRFGKYLIPYWRQEVLILVLLLLNTGGILAGPMVTKTIIDEVIPFGDYDLLFILLIVFLGITIYGALSSIAVEYIFAWVSNRTLIDMRKDVFNHVLQLPQSFYQTNKVGDIVHRINNEVDTIQFAVTASLLRLAFNVITLAGLCAMLCWLNYQLFLMTLGVVPLLFWNLRFFQPRIRRVAELLQKKRADLLGFFQERFGNVVLVQAYDGYRYEDRKHVGKLKGIFSGEMQSTLYSSSMGAAAMFLMGSVPVAVLGWGGAQVMVGAMTLGSVVAYLQYLNRFFGPFYDLNDLYATIVRAFVSMERVFELLEIPAVNRAAGSKEVSFERSIAVRKVSFGFNGEAVLRDFDQEFVRGKSYALVGASGCGKSTLVKLLCRFYSPDSGVISVDGKDLQSLDLIEYRKKIALIMQDNLLFHDTIEENVRYGSWQSPPEAVEAAAQTAGLLELLGEERQGHREEIGDRGTQLSGGQKQRVAVARALLKEADLLILDEAMDTLDSASERAILDDIRRVYADKTVIVISHRLSSVIDADEIVCIDRNRVAERGVYAELMAKRGHFWRLFREQTQEIPGGAR